MSMQNVTTKSDSSSEKSDEVRSNLKVAAIVAVDEYDFGEGRAHIDLGEGRKARISLNDVVFSVVDHKPGSPVLVDGAVVGHLLLATEMWSLVQPTDSHFPSVVSTSRVSFPPEPLPEAA